MTAFASKVEVLPQKKTDAGYRWIGQCSGPFQPKVAKVTRFSWHEAFRAISYSGRGGYECERMVPLSG